MSDLKERLRDTAKSWTDRDGDIVPAARDMLEAADAIERMEKDAERYRWLRSSASGGEWDALNDLRFQSPAEFDSAIDAAKGER